MEKILFIFFIFSILSARADVSIEKCFPDESFKVRVNTSAEHFLLWKNSKILS